MQYHSTFNSTLFYNFATAMQMGLACDGGLFIPEHFPIVELDQFSIKLTYAEFADRLLQHFVDDSLLDQLTEICRNAFNFPVPLTQMNNNTWLLELFHGPTLSFKDFGARFIAECLLRTVIDKPLTILVATSGDTGSAVAAAFYKKQNIRVIVLYPKNKISQCQEQQITCWGENILAVAVKGSFDDCQRIVKSAFADKWWKDHYLLSTANSMNIARLLPQLVYYAYTSLHFLNRFSKKPGFIVPSGNLGNVTAAYWAKLLGFPIREIIMATNANQAMSHYLKTGTYMPFPTITTLANAMDVGNPSNFSRLQHLFSNHAEFKSQVGVISVLDPQIKEAIYEAYHHEGRIICPHTATAYFARQQLDLNPWIIVGTAHPCKFEQVIEPIIKEVVPPNAVLSKLLNSHHEEVIIDATLDYLTKLIQERYKDQ